MINKFESGRFRSGPVKDSGITVNGKAGYKHVI